MVHFLNFSFVLVKAVHEFKKMPATEEMLLLVVGSGKHLIADEAVESFLLTVEILIDRFHGAAIDFSVDKIRLE